MRTSLDSDSSFARSAPGFTMAIDVEELVINPFKEVVERGNEALANAADAAQDDPDVAAHMSKAAQAVVKEGERALKRIQPLWDSHVDRYGDVFKDSIRENGNYPLRFVFPFLALRELPAMSRRQAG